MKMFIIKWKRNTIKETKSDHITLFIQNPPLASPSIEVKNLALALCDWSLISYCFPTQSLWSSHTGLLTVCSTYWHAQTLRHLHWLFSLLEDSSPDTCTVYTLTSFVCLNLTFSIRSALTTLFKITTCHSSTPKLPYPALYFWLSHLIDQLLSYHILYLQC